MERTAQMSHGGSTGFEPPPGVTVHRVPPDRSLGEMLLAGELDATLLYIPGGTMVDRSTADLHNHPDFAPLFPDTYAEGRRYYASTGLYPINHGMVIRREIAERYPWVVLNVMKLFDDAHGLRGSPAHGACPVSS